MLTILNLGKTRELQLTTLMGVSRQKRLFHFAPLFIILPVASFYFQSVLNPSLKRTLKKPETLITQPIFNQLDSGMELILDDWVFGSDSNGNRLIVNNKSDYSTILLCKTISLDKNKHIYALHGHLWTNSNRVDQVVNFERVKLPLNPSMENSAKELSIFNLDFNNLDHCHQAGLIIRNSLAPIFMLYLGFAIGYYGLKLNRGLTFLLCLGSLLLIYLPLQILARSIKVDHLTLQILLLILPFIVCSLLAHHLNKSAERNGVS